MSERDPEMGIGNGSRPGLPPSWYSHFPTLSPYLTPRLRPWPEPFGGPAELVAISGALACPDLFLIDAASGDDQLTLALDVTMAARRTGKRILILTFEPIDADKLLTRCVEAGETLILRSLGLGEPANQLPSLSAERTANAHSLQSIEKVRHTAQAQHRAAQEKLAHLDALRPAIEKFREAEASVSSLRSQITTRVPANLRNELLARYTTNIAEMQTWSNQRDELRTQLAASGGLFGAMKRLFSKEDAGAKLADIEKQLQSCTEKIAASEAELRDCEEALALEARYDEAVVQQQAAQLAITAQGYDADSEPRLRAAATTDTNHAEAVLAEIAARGSQLTDDLLAAVPLVIAPWSAIHHDAALKADAKFDQVILTDTENLTRPDFDRLAAFCPRQVLIGDGPMRNPTKTGTLFQTLFEKHHIPSLRLEAGRLIASLLPTPASAEWICEPLADNPAIELRFAQSPTGPELIEVAFAPRTTVAEAKSFLAQELGRYLLRFPEPFVAEWCETETSIIARAPSLDAVLLGTGDELADLGQGITEQIHGDDAASWTVAVKFAKSADWTLESAQARLQEIGLPPPLRTVRMPRPLFIHERSPNTRTATAQRL
ncbi:MAG: hypothetical protein ACRC8S_00480 [Fimbriiglobus sp.]